MFLPKSSSESVFHCRSLPDPAVLDSSLKHKLEQNRKEGLTKLEQVKQTDYLVFLISSI